MQLQLDPEIQAEAMARSSPDWPGERAPLPAAPSPTPLAGATNEQMARSQAQDPALMLSTFPQWAADAKPPSRFGVNDAGVGLTLGNYQLGLKPTMSTDNRYDNAGQQRRAENAEEDARQAREAGQKVPNPVKEMVSE